MPEPSILDARLAEIDRRLGTIQSGLVAEPSPATPASEASEASGLVAGSPFAPPRAAAAGPPATPPSQPTPLRPAPALPPATPAPDVDLPQLAAQLRDLTDAQERLLASARQLLGAYAGELAQARAGAEIAAPRPVAQPGLVSVSAGPFASTEALRSFARSLLTLPQVRDASIREYAGEDRAVVDVHLSDSTS